VALGARVADLESEICDLKLPCPSSVEAKDGYNPAYLPICLLPVCPLPFA